MRSRAGGEAVSAIELTGISKAFGPVRANRDIAMRVAPGTIHGIIGENGAGKSTLMSILYRFYRADAGEIRVHGQPTAIPDSQAAIRAGVGMVFQHFKLVAPFTVLENVVLGAEGGARLGPSMRAGAGAPARAGGRLRAQCRPRRPGRGALGRPPAAGRDPQGALPPARHPDPRRADRGADAGRGGAPLPHPPGAARRGKTVVLITHKLGEIMEVADTVSVMRRGEMTATVPTRETSATELAELMVGRRVLLRVDKTPARPAGTVLEVDDLNVTGADGVERLKGVSLHVRAGEILGIAGVAGNGQSELLDVLGGIRPATGRVSMRGRDLALAGPGSGGRARRRAAVAHVPEDRQRLGLIMEFAAWENVALGYQDLPVYNRGPLFMDNAAIRADTRAKMERFDVRPPSPGLAAANFSGGNQQKLVLAREMDRDAELLLVGQPIRGVDIGAIEFIHQRLLELRDAGTAILLVSVELDEIRALADRVAVMFDGAVMGERAPEAADDREMGMLMAGMGAEAA